MLSIINITLPIFIMIALGYAAVRFDIINPVQITGLGRFVVVFAYPAVIFHAFASKPVTALFVPSYMLAYGSATILLFIATYLLTLKFKKNGGKHAALNAMGVTYSNSGFIGFPVLSLVVGQHDAAVFLAMNLFIENLISLLPMIVIAESHGQSKRALHLIWGAIKKLLQTPLIIAIFLGMFFSLAHIPLPTIANRVIDMLMISAAPVGIFVIGGGLYGVKIRSNLKEAIWLTLAKLLALPLLVLAFFALIPNVPNEVLMSGFLMASTPMATMYALISHQYGEGKDSSSNLLVCTMLSFFSLSAVLMIWQYLFPYH
ncbi:AEC family transporter [Brackiella oedipodis]|uniref:AEC family transporter n=1 Tax=Brackiella oedipodis TaxID=124225 RepID=UPI0004915EBB|nr:AEC family transporter [Brackiella oedipodis]